MNALTGEYLPIVNSTNLPEKAYYADGHKPQQSTSQTEDDPVKLKISPEAQALITQTEGEFLPPSDTKEDEQADNEESAEDQTADTITEEAGKKAKGTPPPPTEEEEEEDAEEETVISTSILETDEEDEEEIAELEEQDEEVKTEQSKQLSAVGQYATGVVYEYEVGPDGEIYAVDGHVSVDTSSIEGDPKASIQKARALKAAMMSGSEFSSSEAAVVQEASQMEAEAMAEIAAENSKASESASQIASTYGFMESAETSTFTISA